MVRPTRGCPRCGESVDPDAKVCSHCGKDPRWTQEQMASWGIEQWRRYEEHRQDYDEQKGGRGPSRLDTLWVLSGFAALIAFVMALQYPPAGVVGAVALAICLAVTIMKNLGND